MTYAGAAPGAMTQQAVVMQPQPVIYSAPQQPIVYEQAEGPVMFSGQPQAVNSATDPAQVVHEEAVLGVTYAAASATQATCQQAPAVTYAAPAVSQVVAPATSQVVREQSVTYATAPTSQVTYEQTLPTVAAPAAQVTYEQTAPAVTYAAPAAAVPVPTLISYPANAAPAQVSYPSAAVTTVEQPLQFAGSSVQLATEQSVPAAGSVSMVAPQPYMAPLLQLQLLERRPAVRPPGCNPPWPAAARTPLQAANSRPSRRGRADVWRYAAS